MKWIPLTDPGQLDEIRKKSEESPVLIFKHSTSCSISRMAFDRIERQWRDEEMQEITPFYLDLKTYREVSNKIAELFGVVHESPQILLIRNGEAEENYSHYDIDYQKVKAFLKN